MTLRYGLIGAGMMGREHIRNLQLIDGVEVIAIADPDEAMRAKTSALAGDIKSYPTHEELLDKTACDAIIIASPNDTHHAILCDVLQTPAAVLCEKPLCTTAADCRDIMRRAESRNAPVWVAMEYRYMPPVQRLLDAVGGGEIGTPRMLAIREHRFPFLPKVRDWNRFNARTGGTMVEKCCHFWDLMRLVLQRDPVRVFASAGADVNHRDERYDGQTPDIIDNAFVVVDFAGGTRGMLDLCMFAEGSRWQEVVSVTGDLARADAFVPGAARFAPDGKHNAAEFSLSRRADKVVVCEQVAVDETILRAGDHHGSTYFQHLKFRDMLRDGGAPEVSLHDGLWSVLIGEAAEQSARRGEAVSLSV